MFLTALLVLYPAMEIARGTARKFDRMLFPFACVLCLWVHVTSGLMLLGIAVSMLWLKRDVLAKWMHVRSGIVAVAMGCASLFIAGTAAFLFLCSITRRPPMEYDYKAFSRTGGAHLIARPPIKCCRISQSGRGFSIGREGVSMVRRGDADARARGDEFDARRRNDLDDLAAGEKH